MEQNFLSSKVLALSWKQPYAQLMLHGKIETRTWKTDYRGWVLICSSSMGYKEQQVINISGYYQKKRIFHEICYKNEDLMLCGVAIAIGKLVDCRPMTKQDEGKCFVKYHPDLFCHVYENVQPIQPIPWKGTQRWKEVDMETKRKIVLL